MRNGYVQRWPSYGRYNIDDISLLRKGSYLLFRSYQVLSSFHIHDFFIWWSQTKFFSSVFSIDLYVTATWNERSSLLNSDYMEKYFIFIFNYYTYLTIFNLFYTISLKTNRTWCFSSGTFYFPRGWIIRPPALVLWRGRTPDLILLVFFLWSYVKDTVYFSDCPAVTVMEQLVKCVFALITPTIVRNAT